MNRREFSIQTLGAALAATAFTGVSRAQGSAPVEGVNYIKLSQPAPVSAPAGKIEVIEFFWYGCPHCYAFEPSLGPWIKKLPADVSFRRVHAQFTPQWVQHAKLFYALDAVGEVEGLERNQRLIVQRIADHAS